MNSTEKVVRGLELCLASIDEATCPEECPYYETCRNYENRVIFQPVMRDTLELLKKQGPDHSKYEYKYDHTDCLWYRSGDLSQCPSTCSQYRDGWNDAMNYIFKGGKGYQPYKRR